MHHSRLTPNLDDLQAMLDRYALGANDSHRSSLLVHELQFHLISQVVLHSGTIGRLHSRFALDFIDDWQLSVLRGDLGASTIHHLVRLVLETLSHLNIRLDLRSDTISTHRLGFVPNSIIVRQLMLGQEVQFASGIRHSVLLELRLLFLQFVRLELR